MKVEYRLSIGFPGAVRNDVIDIPPEDIKGLTPEKVEEWIEEDFQEWVNTCLSSGWEILEEE